jgi:hypothetical protein
VSNDLFLPTTGIHLEREESTQLGGTHTYWSRRGVAVNGVHVATMRAHEYRGTRYTIRTLSLIVVDGNLVVAHVRAPGRDWTEAEHVLRTKAHRWNLGDAFDAFVYQRQAVA